MKQNTKAREQDATVTSLNKRYIETNQILYDAMVAPIKSNIKSKVVAMSIEQQGIEGWSNPTLKEIVIKEMANKGWGWRAGNYVNGITNTIEFVFIGTVSYKGPGTPSVLAQEIPA